MTTYQHFSENAQPKALRPRPKKTVIVLIIIILAFLLVVAIAALLTFKLQERNPEKRGYVCNDEQYFARIKGEIVKCRKVAPDAGRLCIQDNECASGACTLTAPLEGYLHGSARDVYSSEVRLNEEGFFVGECAPYMPVEGYGDFNPGTTHILKPTRPDDDDSTIKRNMGTESAGSIL